METLRGAGRFLYHYPLLATVVTSGAEGKENAMTAAWTTPISIDPPLYGVSISPKRFTYKLILKSGDFAVNFLPYESSELMASLGGSTGREVDKFSKFKLAKIKPIKTNAPILRDAYAAYECKLFAHNTYGDHELVVGEVLAVHYLKEAFDDKGIINFDRVKPALYLGSDFYLSASKNILRHLDRQAYGKR